MKEINDQIKNFLVREKSDNLLQEYRKLIGFIDASLSQAFNYSGDERAQFLVKNMLNMRDFLSAETIEESFKSDIYKTVAEIVENETSKYEWVKKKEESEETVQQHSLESLLEIDPKT